ncbi:MAG: helix-turn-helix transcriptional regulator [Acidimicrobiales bacterium]
MRSARLLAMLLRLQRTGPATAATLAAELEVSERTVYRDVASLQQAGVPLWTETGPHGGIRLIEGWRSPVDGFTAAETVALTLGTAGAADLGLGAVLTAARSKLRSSAAGAAGAAGGAGPGGDLAHITARFLLDAPGWFHRDEASPALAAVAQAVWDGNQLDITYASRGRTVERLLDPLGLVLKAGTWYLVAAHRQVPRTYRVSRIGQASVVDRPAWRPDEFDLGAWWATSAAEFDVAIRPLLTRLRVSPDTVRLLTRLVPGPATRDALAAGRVDDGGWTEIDLPLESVRVAVTQLAPLPGVEVLSPAELRTALAAHAERLAALNR